MTARLATASDDTLLRGLVNVAHADLAGDSAVLFVHDDNPALCRIALHDVPVEYGLPFTGPAWQVKLLLPLEEGRYTNADLPELLRKALEAIRPARRGLPIFASLEDETATKYRRLFNGMAQIANAGRPGRSWIYALTVTAALAGSAWMAGRTRAQIAAEIALRTP